MRIAGYIPTPNVVIFEGLEHIMRYLYFFHHMSIMYPRRPLNKRSLAMHGGEGTAEYLSPEYGTVLVNTADAEHTWDIRVRRSITSSTHLINGVAIAWKCKKQAATTLHSNGSEITSLTSGAKKTNHLLDFLASIGYPVGAPNPTFEDNQGNIKAIRASRTLQYKTSCDEGILAQRTIQCK
jgi:hypothetical protein